MITTYQLDDYVPNGSSFKGHITALYQDLIDTFGEPNMPFSDKVWNEWSIRFIEMTTGPGLIIDEDDHYVTIYDWKETHPNQSRYGEYRWNVGSKSRKAVGLVLDALNEPATMERLDG